MHPLLLVGVGVGAYYLWDKVGKKKEVLTGHPQAGEVWTLVFKADRTISASDWQGYMQQNRVVSVTGNPSQYVVTVKFAAPTTLKSGPYDVAGTRLTLLSFARAPINT